MSFNDTATAWAWTTDRLITVSVRVEGEVSAAMLTVSDARELLNQLTDAIAEIDDRSNSEESLAALRRRLTGK